MKQAKKLMIMWGGSIFSQKSLSVLQVYIHTNEKA